MVQLVKFLRPILVGLGLIIVLLGLLVGAAFIPGLQTWWLQSKLDARPDIRGSVGSLSAGLGQVDLTDLHLETAEAVIDVPSLHAVLPVKQAAWDGKVQVRSLVAKGWTIDLSRTLEPEKAPGPEARATRPVKAAETTATAPATPEALAVQNALKILRSIVGGRALPCDLSLDGVELEGDVIVATPERGTVQVHVSLKGGGVAAGREGDFALEADAVSPWPGIREAALHGHALVTAKSPRRLDRIVLKSDLAIGREAPAADTNVAVAVALAHDGTETTYALDLSQGPRHLANLLVHCPDATHQLDGDWKVDLRGSDLALFTTDLPSSAFSVTGAGRFEADPAFTRQQLRGRLDASAEHLGFIAPPLDRLGAATLSVQFSLERSGQVIRCNELAATLATAGPVASVHALQPFDFNAPTGVWKVADPRGDWMAGTIRKFPLAWCTSPEGTLALTGSPVAGDFLVRATAGGFSLRPKKTWAVAGATLQRAGRPLVGNLDLSLDWSADCDAGGWRMQWAPLAVSRAGRRLATIGVKASRPAGPDETIVVNGTWDADLEAVAALPEIPRAAGLTARSAAGEFTANVGAQSQVEGKMTVRGHDPTHTLTASVSADQDAEGKWTFQLPVKMTFGREVTDFSGEGSWTDPAVSGRSYVRLTGEKMFLAHLRMLAAPLGVFAGVRWPEGPALGLGGAPSPPGEPDRVPFWGQWAGTVVFECDQLQAGEKTYRNVGGTLEFDPGAVQLEHIRGRQGQTTPVMLEGRIAFAAGDKEPYTLQGSGSFGEIDAATLLPPAKPDEDPLLEGHFSVAVTLSGSGINLGDLAGRTQEEYRLTSKGGIVRLLKTYIGDAFQDEEPSAVSSAVGSVGSLVGKLFAVKDSPKERKLSKTTESVLDLSSQVAELEYESLELTALKSPDGSIRLTEFTMTGPNERLTGTGRITGARNRPYTAQPLALDLVFAARGRTAELMAKAGLLSKEKDRQGFANLIQPLHFGGSLEHLDQTAWHDLLIKAMKRQPAGG